MTSHLDDEALSSVIDGEASEDAVAHARSCEPCANRLKALAAAARAVGLAPPAPPPPRREAILAAALAAAAPHAAPDAVTGRPSPPSRGLASFRPWLAAAAAVAALAVAVPVVRSQLGPDLDGTMAAGRDSSATGEAAPSPGPPEAGGIDLDALRADPPTVDELAARLSPQQRAGPEAVPAPESLAARGPADAPPAADSAAGASTCEAIVRRRHPDLGELAYANHATVEGAPAEILAFEVPPGTGDDGVTHRLVVSDPGTCAEVAAVPLPG